MVLQLSTNSCSSVCISVATVCHWILSRLTVSDKGKLTGCWSIMAEPLPPFRFPLSAFFLYVPVWLVYIAKCSLTLMELYFCILGSAFISLQWVFILSFTSFCCYIFPSLCSFYGLILEHILKALKFLVWWNVIMYHFYIFLSADFYFKKSSRSHLPRSYHILFSRTVVFIRY